MFNKKEKRKAEVEAMVEADKLKEQEELIEKRLSVEFYLDTNPLVSLEETAEALGFDIEFVNAVYKEKMERHEKRSTKLFLMRDDLPQKPVTSSVDTTLSMEQLDVEKVSAFLKTFSNSKVSVQIRIKGEF